MTSIHVHLAASEEAAKLFQDRPTTGSLHNHKGRLDLPAKRHALVAKDRAAKTALSVDKADDPSLVQESFLLIFRISHFVTAAHGALIQLRCINAVDDESWRIHRFFQHIADYSPHAVTHAGAAPLSCKEVFPTLGTLLLRSAAHIERCGRTRLGHFCPAPHVAMRVGLYLHLQTPSIRYSVI